MDKETILEALKADYKTDLYKRLIQNTTQTPGAKTNGFRLGC
jgi:hypothetical protein